MNITLMNAGFILRFIIESLLKCLGMRRSVKAMRNAKRMDNYELDQMLVDRNNFRKEFSKRWQEWGISAIVSPAFPTCAFNAKDA